MSPVYKHRFLNLQEYNLFFFKMTHIDGALVSQRLCLHGPYLPLGLHYSLRDGIGVKEASCSLYQSGCNQPLGFFLMNNDVYTVDTSVWTHEIIRNNKLLPSPQRYCANIYLF